MRKMKTGHTNKGKARSLVELCSGSRRFCGWGWLWPARAIHGSCRGAARVRFNDDALKRDATFDVECGQLERFGRAVANLGAEVVVDTRGASHQCGQKCRRGKSCKKPFHDAPF